MGAGGGVVAEGRDIQTVVFPDAEVKIFLTASTQERAKRRFFELKTKDAKADEKNIEKEMEKRDQRDSTRADSPLRVAPDAVIIDSEGKTIEEILNEVLVVVRRIEETADERA
jgi:cytidylate kinase